MRHDTALYRLICLAILALTAQPPGSAAIRAAAARHPLVEVIDVGGSTRAGIERAELVGWLDDQHVLVAQDGRLAIYDSRGVKTRDVPLAVRRAADAFVR